MATTEKQSIAPRLDKDARRERMALAPQPVLNRDPEARLNDFDEILVPFTPEQAMAEASRCLLCPGAPCANACLLGNDIPGAMWLISQGDFLGAAKLYRQTSAMPEICGRVCPQESLCEGTCVLGKKGAPIALGRLEAFVADYERTRQGLPTDMVGPDTGKHVAIIGAGPAGIAAADWLRRFGHAVTVYEALPEPGGLLIYGIPSFKLNKQIVKEKIDQLREMGVRFICNSRVGKDIAFEELRQQYDAIFIGTGASIDATAKIEGIDLPGVHQATNYLIRANLPPEILPPDVRAAGPLPVGRRVTVFGGGDTAMDCVRTALRLQKQAGYEPNVTCVYRRTEEEMPGNSKERKHAREEHARFEFLTAPVRFIADEAGQLCAAECVRMELGEPDESGRRRPIKIPGSEFILETDQAILALGYWPDPLLGEKVEGLETHDWGLITVDPETGETSLPGVFAGGDNDVGPSLVGTAVAAAIRAARAIDQYLS